MFKDKKDTPPTANIGKLSAAANTVPRTAREEWETVHTYEEAMKWHLKWTPWFTKDMIEGILKYAYPTEILKDGKEKILSFTGDIRHKNTPTSNKISMSVTVIPKEENEISEEKKILRAPMKRAESTSVTLKKTESTASPKSSEGEPIIAESGNHEPEEISSRFERFWTLNP